MRMAAPETREAVAVRHSDQSDFHCHKIDTNEPSLLTIRIDIKYYIVGICAPERTQLY